MKTPSVRPSVLPPAPLRRRAFLLGSLAAGLGALRCGGPAGPSASVGCKTFSEQLILGEAMSRFLEADGLSVTRRFSLQTPILHAALLAGDLDCYIEYTGTAYATVLGETFNPGDSAATIHERVRALYRERFDLVVGPPIGFANDFVIALRPERAAELGLVTISDLSRAASGLVLTAGFPFFEREDGFSGLLEWYGFEAAPETVAVDLDMVWPVLEAGDADLLVGNSTDGRLARLGLVVLEDDRAWFPPYESAVFYRPDAARAVAALAERLGGAIDTPTMRALNRRVDVDRERPEVVAADLVAALSG